MAEAISRRNLRPLLGSKALVALLYAAASGAGFLPYAILVRSTWIWIICVGVVVIIFILSTRSRDAYAGESPSYLEIAISMLGRCAAGASFGLFGIIVDYLVAALLSLLVASDTAAWWSFYVSAVTVIFFAVAITAGDAADVLGALYPDRPGQRSPYFPIANEAAGQWRIFMRLAAPILGFAATLIVMSVAVLAPYSTEALVGWTFLMMVAGGGYLEVKTIDSEHGTPRSTIADVTALLEAAKYKVIASPRTGDADADSVISILDFLALRPKDSIAGRIRAQTSRPGGDPRHEAGMLEPAVWVLEDQLWKQGQTRIKLKPTLLVLGDTAEISSNAEISPNTETLTSNTEVSATRTRKSVRIVRGPSEADLAALVAAEDKEPLKALAERLFGATSSEGIS
jgi:hypothetical protein